jgi:hypothetical protein
VGSNFEKGIPARNPGYLLSFTKLHGLTASGSSRRNLPTDQIVDGGSVPRDFVIKLPVEKSLITSDVLRNRSYPNAPPIESSHSIISVSESFNRLGDSARKNSQSRSSVAWTMRFRRLLKRKFGD